MTDYEQRLHVGPTQQDPDAYLDESFLGLLIDPEIQARASEARAENAGFLEVLLDAMCTGLGLDPWVVRHWPDHDADYRFARRQALEALAHQAIAEGVIPAGDLERVTRTGLEG